ncbi:hypothetical protein GCM10010435_29620 [Winogradskya consettensis]|uniref:Uncharacterized protein n=1 Tax=Winogradskya consettensis TaxID=113560 RepID=A0A919SF88_9ACTN|nr:hypothetical protein Aco04nite_21880 [Actinoplanes consettensis]
MTLSAVSAPRKETSVTPDHPSPDKTPTRPHNRPAAGLYFPAEPAARDDPSDASADARSPTWADS